MEELEYLKKTNVQTTVYVTQPQDYNGMKSFEQDSNSEKKSDEKDSVESPQNSFVSKIKQDLSHVEFIEGRQTLLNKLNKKSRKQTVHLGSLRVDILPWLMN